MPFTEANFENAATETVVRLNIDRLTLLIYTK